MKCKITLIFCVITLNVGAHAADLPKKKYYNERKLNNLSKIALIDRDFLQKESLEELKIIFFSLNVRRFTSVPRMSELAVYNPMKEPTEAFKIKRFQALYDQVKVLLPEKLVEELTTIQFDKPLSPTQLDTYILDIELLRSVTKIPASWHDEYKKLVNMKTQQLLKNLALCPVFVGLAENPKFHELINLNSITQAQISAMNEDDQLAYQIEKASGISLWFKTSFTDNPERLACFVNYTPPLKNGDGMVRQIIQMRTVNQSIGQFKKIGTQHCSGLSLRNAICLNEYANSRNEEFLRKLYSEDGAIGFLKDYECKERIEKSDIENNKYFKTFPKARKHIAVIDSPLVLDQKHQEALTTSGIDEITRIKSYIKSGLSHNDFYFSFIVGTLDERALSQELPEHWYCFSIIKSGDLIRYVIVDTSADYHLQPGSYELMRLNYFIDLLEQGSSEIDITKEAK